MNQWVVLTKRVVLGGLCKKTKRVTFAKGEVVNQKVVLTRRVVFAIPKLPLSSPASIQMHCVLARKYGCLLRLVQCNLSDPYDQDTYDHYYPRG